MDNKPNYGTEVLGNALHITIPSPKKLFTIIFFSIWLAFWSFGSAFALQAIGSDEVELFWRLWSIMWVAGEIAGVYHLLWQIVGKEEIEVTPDFIAIRHAILGIGRSTVYASINVSNMRVDPAGREEPYARTSEGISFSKGTGMIAFDYRGKTVRIGIGINKNEAKELVAEIQRQYPLYKK